MLLGNYSVLSKSPGRFLAGSTTSVEGQVRSNWNKSGMNRNRFIQDMGGVSTALTLYAEPTGYYQPYAWIFPQISGQIGSSKFITAAGTVSAGNLAGGLNGDGPLSGSGDISSATGALIVSAVAALTGGGDISVAQINAIVDAVSALTAAGDISGAALLAKGVIAAVVIGVGDTAGTLNGPAGMSADVVVTGDLLSTANVADAILDALNGVEQGLTVREAMRLISAAVAGKVSGGGTSTVTFRSAEADDKDRIVATVDASGNRTAITTDLT